MQVQNRYAAKKRTRADLSDWSDHVYKQALSLSVLVQMSVIQLRYSPVGCGVPQKSTVDTREFISYTQDVEELIQSHSLALHLYADDTQLLSVMQL